MSNPITDFVDGVVGAYTAAGNVLDAGAAKAVAQALRAKNTAQAAEILGSAGIVQSAGEAGIAGANAANNTNVGNAIWAKLDDRGTWIRIAEGALGLGLILVAITHITGAGKVSNLPAHIAKNGIKVAAA